MSISWFSRIGSVSDCHCDLKKKRILSRCAVASCLGLTQKSQESSYVHLEPALAAKSVSCIRSRPKRVQETVPSEAEDVHCWLLVATQSYALTHLVSVPHREHGAPRYKPWSNITSEVLGNSGVNSGLPVAPSARLSSSSQSPTNQSTESPSSSFQVPHHGL